MTMFSAACYQFVKSVGKNTLHPAPSIDQKDNLKPLQLVVKSTKRKYFFFTKSTYYPTDFQITDVLTNDSPLRLDQQVETELSNYNRKTELSLKGKFGADLAKEIIDVELEADDTITVNIDFGKVMKKDVNIPDLMSEINRRNINMSHNYIKQIRKDSKSVLCIISGVAYLDKSGTIHRETKMDASASLTTKLTKTISPSAGGEYDKGRDLGLAPGTPVAYCVHELNVDSNSGGIELVLAQGKTGGFKEGISYDEVDAKVNFSGDIRELMDIDFQSPKKLFEPLLSLPEEQRREMTNDLLCILDSPCDLLILANLLETCETKQCSPNGEELKLRTPKHTVERVLGQAGFTFKDDKALAPKSDNSILTCLTEFFDAASELDDDILDLITKCSQDMIVPLMTVLQEGIRGKTVSNDGLIGNLAKDPEASHMKLLQELRFRITPAEIQAPVELPYYIDEIYWVLTALWAMS